jgi:hypothetical protein
MAQPEDVGGNMFLSQHTGELANFHCNVTQFLKKCLPEIWTDTDGRTVWSHRSDLTLLDGFFWDYVKKNV